MATMLLLERRALGGPVAVSLSLCIFAFSTSRCWVSTRDWWNLKSKSVIMLLAFRMARDLLFVTSLIQSDGPRP